MIFKKCKAKYVKKDLKIYIIDEREGLAPFFIKSFCEKIWVGFSLFGVLIKMIKIKKWNIKKFIFNFTYNMIYDYW